MGYFSTPHYRQMPGHSVHAGTSANCVPPTAGHWPEPGHPAFTKFLASQQSRINLFCHYAASAVELIHLFRASCPQYTTQSTSDVLRASQCPTLVEQSHNKFNLSSILSGRIRKDEVYPAYFTSPRPWEDSLLFWKNSAHSLSPHLCNEYCVSNISTFPSS